MTDTEYHHIEVLTSSSGILFQDQYSLSLSHLKIDRDICK